MPQGFRIELDEACDAPGIDDLLGEAWTESGRSGAPIAGWRPFETPRCEGILVRSGGVVDAFAAVRPAPGMDGIEFLFVRKAARRAALIRALLERCGERLRATGLTRIIYAGFGWWRAPFPAPVARAFLALDYRRFEGVFLAHRISGQGPAPSPVERGYEVVPFEDAYLEETIEVMLASPEPEAIYWDDGLCRRSIAGAANSYAPLFPDGRGQLALRNGRVVGFALATQSGYVNHVYTHPEHRGRRLASALITRLLGALARQGVLRATILTHETNPHAIAVYERLGFAVDFRFPQFYVKW